MSKNKPTDKAFHKSATALVAVLVSVLIAAAMLPMMASPMTMLAYANDDAATDDGSTLAQGDSGDADETNAGGSTDPNSSLRSNNGTDGGNGRQLAAATTPGLELSADIEKTETYKSGKVSVKLTLESVDMGEPDKIVYVIDESPNTPASIDAYTKEETLSRLGKAKLSIDGSGVKYLHVIGYDDQGDSTFADFGPYLLDNEKPSIKSAPSVSYAFNEAFIEVKGTDGDSGVRGYAIVKKGVRPPAASATAKWTEADEEGVAVLMVEAAGNYDVYALDNAGNVSSAKSVNIKKLLAPTIAVVDPSDKSTPKANGSGTTTKPLKVLVKVGSEIDGASVQWSYVIDGKSKAYTSLDDSEDWSLLDDSASQKLTFEDEGTWYLHVYAIDDLGNEACSTFGPYKIKDDFDWNSLFSGDDDDSFSGWSHSTSGKSRSFEDFLAGLFKSDADDSDDEPSSKGLSKRSSIPELGDDNHNGLMGVAGIAMAVLAVLCLVALFKREDGGE